VWSVVIERWTGGLTLGIYGSEGEARWAAQNYPKKRNESIHVRREHEHRSVL
jgi:hypothetical protein